MKFLKRHRDLLEHCTREQFAVIVALDNTLPLVQVAPTVIHQDLALTWVELVPEKSWKAILTGNLMQITIEIALFDCDITSLFLKQGIYLELFVETLRIFLSRIPFDDDKGCSVGFSPKLHAGLTRHEPRPV